MILYGGKFKPRAGKCFAEVYDKYTHITRQCSFYNGKGPGKAYCRKHAELLQIRPLAVQGPQGATIPSDPTPGVAKKIGTPRVPQALGI